MKFLKAIRYSAIGIFFTGIISAIQGCQFSELLAACRENGEACTVIVALLFLNFCSGPVPVEVSPALFTFGSDFEAANSISGIRTNTAFWIIADGSANTTVSPQAGILNKFSLQLDNTQDILNLPVTFFIARGADPAKPTVVFVQAAVLDNTSCNNATKICEIDAIGSFALLSGDYVGIHNASGSTIALESEVSGNGTESQDSLAAISVGVVLSSIASFFETFIQATGE